MTFISSESHCAKTVNRPDPLNPDADERDDPVHDNPGTMTDPDLDDTMRERSEHPHQPWHVPGVGTSL
jgi:hypothetical protein